MGAASLLEFHPFDPYIAVADGKDSINVWNWQEGHMTQALKNTNPPGSRITSMRFINAHDDSLMMVGSNEGVVRIWRNWDGVDGEAPAVVSGWRALSDLLPSTRGSGLV